MPEHPSEIPKSVFVAAAILWIVAVVVVLVLHHRAGPVHVSAHAPHNFRVRNVIVVAATPPAPPKPPAPPSDFDREQRMTFGEMMRRWNPLITEASKRFGVPVSWIRAVMQAESGGRTMLSETQPIVSDKGAMGLMQLMPQTYDDMRKAYALGANPFDPHDNIMAGTAYLRFLRSKYPYPTMFEAYNDGPGHLEERLANGGLLPLETQLYVANITNHLAAGGNGTRANMAIFTRPNGSPVTIDATAVVAIRAAFPGEYAPGVTTVITVGKIRQGVRENLSAAKLSLRAHGAGI